MNITRTARRIQSVSDLPSRSVRSPKCRYTLFHHKGDTDHKQNQRNRVLDHFLAIGKKNNIRCFSLPGEKWLFENMLFDSRERVLVVACEHDSVTFERGVKFMPGIRHTRHEWWVKELNDYVSVFNSTTNDAYFLNVHARLLLTGNCTFSHWKTRSSATRLYYFNAIWIDAFGPLGCESYLDTLHGIAKRQIRNVHCAFSFMIGRDQTDVCRVFDLFADSSALDRRASFITTLFKNHNRQFVVTDTFSYPSWNTEGSVTMGTVLGILKPATTT